MYTMSRRGTIMNWMNEALKEAYKGIDNGEGGPFGSVIVKDNQIIGRGRNEVILLKDPTCHGEMMAIRNACHHLDTFDLTGCELYTTAEPCPMCLGAILWANIDKVFYGCTRTDSADIGFRDDKFYNILNGKDNSLSIEKLDREQCLELFKKYEKKQNKISY